MPKGRAKGEKVDENGQVKIRVRELSEDARRAAGVT